nr:BRCA1-associated RING domain protein 1-like [Leptinotarsa decemlineata]
MGEEYTTPLHKATVSQKMNLIILLLKYGADKEMIDIFGKTPIDYAKTETVQNILKEHYHPIERTEMLCCNKKMVAYCYYIEQDYRDKLKKRKIKILEEYDSKKVTHFLIRRTHKISLKILESMLDGCIILPQEWIDSFLNNDLFIPIPDYTFINNVKMNKGIQRAMMNHLLKCPKLFSGINFFISGHKSFVKIHDIKFTKEHIASLIIAGGGKLLHRAPALRTCDEVVNFPYHARNSAAKCCNYIIYEENNPPDLRYQMPEIKHKSSNWLVECVIDFKILD